MMKRLFDILAASCALILSAPLIAVLAYKVSKNLGRPVLFTQARPGKNETIFNMVKFRTMKDATDRNGIPLPDADRLTPFGLRLRNASLDELPELWNVLKGEMSIVGPRPLLVEYLPLYNQAQRQRHQVKPGITGWAQINGRNSLSWEEKFSLDCWYVEHQSMWLDIKIILLTIKKVFTKADISASGHVTMPAFTGTKNNHEHNGI